MPPRESRYDDRRRTARGRTHRSGPTCRAPCTPSGTSAATTETRSRCSSSRRHAGAGARPGPLRSGWRSRRSRSSGAPRRSWRWTSRPPGHRPDRCRRAVTPTSRTSASSRHPSATWCSTSTTSTRRCPARGSGTSSGLRRACKSSRRSTGSRPRAADGVVLAAVRVYREYLDAVRDDGVRSTSGTTAPTVDDLVDHFPMKYRAQVERDVARALRKDHLRAVAKLTDRRRRSSTPFVEDPPIVVHLDRHRRRHGRRRGDGGRLPRVTVRRPALPVRPVPGRRRRPQGRRRRQRRDPVLGRACFEATATDRRDRPRASRSRRRSRRCSRPMSGRPTSGHEGKRVVAGQRLTQAASDIFLGWCDGPAAGTHYYVRQLWDVKGQGDLMDGPRRPHPLRRALRPGAGPAHARTGDASRSPATSAAARRSTPRSPGSPREYAATTSGITPRWWTPSRQVESPQKAAE